MTTETPTPTSPTPTLWQRINTPLEGVALRRAQVVVAINVIGWAVALAFATGQLVGTLGTIASLR